MKTTLQKWGNSYAVRIKKDVAEHLNVDIGTEFSIKKTKTGLTLEIQDIKKESKLKLENLLKGISAKNSHKVLLDDGPRGKELW